MPSTSGHVEGTRYVLTEPEEPAQCTSDPPCASPLSPLPLVCCIHGVAGYHSVFHPLTRHLVALGFRVLQFDLIGRGDSSFHSNGMFGIDEHIDQLLSLLNSLGIHAPVHLVGHSIGGAIATVFAARLPKRVQSLTLVAPAGLMNLGSLWTLRRLPTFIQNQFKHVAQRYQESAWRRDFCNHEMSRDVEEATVSDLRRNALLHPNAFEASWRTLMQFPLHNLQEPILTVCRTEIRVLLMWGKRDRTVQLLPSFPRWLALMASTGSEIDVTTRFFEYGAHGLLLEFPDMCNEAIASHLLDQQLSSPAPVAGVTCVAEDAPAAGAAAGSETAATATAAEGDAAGNAAAVEDARAGSSPRDVDLAAPHADPASASRANPYCEPEEECASADTGPGAAEHGSGVSASDRDV